MIIIQSKDVIASRCKGLMMLVYSTMEIANGQTDKSYSTVLLSQLHANSESFGLTADEVEIIQGLQEPDSSEKTRILNKGIWKIEELGTLLWCLNIVDVMPACTTQFDVEILNLMKEFQERGHLRETAQLEKQKEYYTTINWRYHISFFRALGAIGKDQNVDEIISKKVTDLMSRGILNDVIDGDIGINGVKYEQLNGRLKESIKNICEARLKVFNWLEGRQKGNKGSDDASADE